MKVLATVGAMTAFGSYVSAFVTPFSVSRVASPLRMSDAAADEMSRARSDEMSRALPWLKQPKNLDGMAGNFGFDPLGLATIFPAKAMQEGELKNGRVAMLAFVGYLVSEVVHLPGPAFQSDNPLDAMAAVGPVPMTIIFFFCGALEWYFHDGKMTANTMFDDGQEPGNYGFDPLELSTKPEELEKYKLQEIKHGRLAMIAMIVLMRQSAVLHGGVPFHAGGIPFIS